MEPEEIIVERLPSTTDYPVGTRIAVVQDGKVRARFTLKGDGHKRYWDRA